MGMCTGQGDHSPKLGRSMTSKNRLQLSAKSKVVDSPELLEALEANLLPALAKKTNKKFSQL